MSASLLVDLTPLKKHRNYRLLFSAQIISYFGTSLTQVAVPYQLHALTHSTAQVGYMGIFQIIPLTVGAILGGKLADREDRRQMILQFELILALLMGSLALLTARGGATTTLLYIFVACSSLFTGLHRPSLDALGPQLVPREEYLSMSALNGFRYTFAALIGPSLAAWLITSFPLQWIYVIDGCSYLISIFWIFQIRSPKLTIRGDHKELSWKEGFERAWKTPLLLGTYLVD
ncbi:MAG: MFS transporter, partial [Proteobacteria bacterium]